MDEFEEAEAPIVVPSFEDRREHPALISRSEWNAILESPDDRSLRDFLNSRAVQIHHVVVDDHGILIDLDTLGDYARGFEGMV